MSDKSFELSVATSFVNKVKDARDRGLDFDMTLKVFAEIRRQTHCAYSGLPFENDGPMKLSMERIDNAIGYVDGNVIAVSKHFNCVRNSLTLETIDQAIEKAKAESIAAQQCYDLIQADIAKMVSSYTPVVIDYNTKPRISRKQFKKWAHLETTMMHHKAKLEKREKMIADIHDLLAKNPSKIKRVHHKTNLEIHEGIRRKLVDGLMITVRQVNQFVKQCQVTENKTENKRIDYSQTYTSSKALPLKQKAKHAHEKHESKARRVEHLEIIKKALKRFDNLSDSDRAKIKMGLSIDTKMTTYLKHRIGQSLQKG